MMGFPLLQNLKQLGISDILVLGFIGIVIGYWFFSKKIHYLLFALILSASFIGSTIPIVDNVANLTRWIMIFLFFGMGFLQSRVRISFGLLLWWAYIFLGFIFLLRGNHLIWQFQRGVLLILVSIAIPFTFSKVTYKYFDLSFVSISIAASIFSVVNFLPLAGSLINPIRYQGYAKGAATFAVILGGLLPFMLWGVLSEHSKIIRITCLLGFLLGFITLVFTGQRTGTLAGLISIFPLIFVMLRRRNLGWFLFLLMILSIFSIYILRQTSLERINFLLFRYSASSGLSYREVIWDAALAEIAKNPILGRGIGAAETIISSSFHNAYLEVWFNTGFVGLVFFVTAQFYFLIRAVYLSVVSKSSAVKLTLALSLGYLLSFMLMSLVESTGATASSVNMILFLFLGVYLSNPELLEPTFQFEKNAGMEISENNLKGSLEKNFS